MYRVYGRIRPMSSTGYGNAARDTVTATITDEFTIKIDGEKIPKTFEYDKMFGMESTQEEIFEDVGDMVQSAADGYNVCIFAYGESKMHHIMTNHC